MIPENTKERQGIVSGRDAEEPEKRRKGSNLVAMLENSNQNKGIKSEHDAGEHEIKGRDQIKAQCQRT